MLGARRAHARNPLARGAFPDTHIRARVRAHYCRWAIDFAPGTHRGGKRERDNLMRVCGAGFSRQKGEKSRGLFFLISFAAACPLFAAVVVYAGTRIRDLPRNGIRCLFERCARVLHVYLPPRLLVRNRVWRPAVRWYSFYESEYMYSW